MEREKIVSQDSKTLISPSSSGRRSSVSSHSSSPEFEFWMFRNPSNPQPDLLSADELFVNGVLLPLDLLPTKQQDPKPPPDGDPAPPEPPASASSPENESGPPVTSKVATTSTASKRWRDIFRKDRGKVGIVQRGEERKKKTEKKNQSQRGTSTAELNINIWPFSRSRSAGNTWTRPRMGFRAPARKVNSAPCSRSNSAGESKSRVKWPSSPARAGVHLGRSSPVWQVRCGAGSGIIKSSEAVDRSGEKGGGKKEVTEVRRGKIINGGGGNKARVLNLNVPMCVGYRNHLSSRSEESHAVVADDGGDCGSKADVGSGGNLFGLRNLINKKVCESVIIKY